MSPSLKRIVGYIVALFIVSVLLFCMSKAYATMVENILLGIFGALVIFICIDFVDYLTDKKKFGKLAGFYVRIDFKLPDRSRTADSIWIKDNPFERGVEFKLNYKGNRRYEAIVPYPDGPSRVKAVLYADPDDANLGNGSYQYLDKPIADFGTYNFHVDQKDPTKIYVYHKNVVPSGIAEGLEIWKKIR